MHPCDSSNLIHSTCLQHLYMTDHCLVVATVSCSMERRHSRRAWEAVVAAAWQTSLISLVVAAEGGVRVSARVMMCDTTCRCPLRSSTMV